MKELICRFHVIIKYFGRNKASERFFPIMFIGLWFNILIQSIAYIIFSHLTQTNPNLNISSGLSDESIKAILIGMFFLTVLGLFLIVRDERAYSNAEEWYVTMPNNRKFNLTFITGILVIVLFLTFLIWAVYLM